MSKPSQCDRRTQSHDIVGRPCSECGHTNLVHPGAQNPTLTECVICLLLVTIEEAKT